MNVIDAMDRLRMRWAFLVPVLLADLGGMVFGWYYYWDVGQFNPASVHYEAVGWWPLVADSPNAVLLFFVAVLVFKLTGWRNKWLDAAALILNVYVGLWTSYLFIIYADTMGTWDWGSTNNILFFSHLGMPLQTVVLVRRMRGDSWRLPQLGALVLAAALYIFVDYWAPMLHPAPFLHGDDRLLHLGSPWLMVAAVGAWLALCRPWPKPEPK